MAVKIKPPPVVQQVYASARLVSPPLRRKVEYYSSWLEEEAHRMASIAYAQEAMEYRHHASTRVKAKGKEIVVFAPFRPEFSAFQTWSRSQLIILGILLLIGVIGILTLGIRHVLTIILALITLMYLCNLAWNMLMSIRSFHHLPEECIDPAIIQTMRNVHWPSYTILCPLYREAQVVPQFIQAMRALDYPVEQLQILLLTEQSDHETRQALRALDLPAHMQIVTVPEGYPRTKPRACNYGLLQATGQYIVIYDAEDIPDPLQLKKALLTFANHGENLGCVQAKLNFYNADQNILTRWFTSEYSLWFDLVLPGLQSVGCALPLGGTSNHFRTSTLRKLGGWDAFNVTEDCDLGLRMARARLQTVVLDSTTYEEANSQPVNWLRQRSRWIKGYMQTYLVHMRHLSSYCERGRWREFFSLQILLGSGTSVLFLNPLMWALLAMYMLFTPQLVTTYHHLFPTPIMLVGTLCLVFGNFYYMYLYLLGCIKRRQYRLVPWTLLIPCYWMMISMAGFLALFELLVKPHYWQKTLHGLHFQRHDGLQFQKRIGLHFQSRVGGPLVGLWGTGEAGQPEAHKGSSYAGIVKRGDPIGVHFSLLSGCLGGVGTDLSCPATQPRNRQEMADTINRSLRHPNLVGFSLKFTCMGGDPTVAYTTSDAAQMAMERVSGPKIRNMGLLATVLTACIASISACVYFMHRHQVLLYADAYSHMRLARSVFDSITPGMAQLGGVWLPLPHVLMLPLIWNSYLWHSGLAGSIVSMACYVATAAYLYLSVQQLTHSGGVSFLCSLLFLFNPNILYLQATPLSELVWIWTMTMTTYYFLLWARRDSPKDLILAAAGSFLATLARYEGWAVFCWLLLMVVGIGLLRRHRREQIQSNVLLFGSLGGFGIVLWLLWNQVIFGDYLYFQHGMLSPQVFLVRVFQSQGLFYTYHNIQIAFLTYAIDAMQTCGPTILIAAACAVLLFLLRQRISPEFLAVTALLVPFFLYVYTLYTGQAIIWVPGAVPRSQLIQIFNVRYGATMVVPAAIFLSVLMHTSYDWLHGHLRTITKVLVGLVILGQVLLVASGSNLALEDGQRGASCIGPHPVNVYLARHYSGGRILLDLMTDDSSITETGLDFRTIVYDGSGPLWKRALHQPDSVVDWIIIDKSRAAINRVVQALKPESAAFLAHFTPAIEEPGGLTLYHRNGAVSRSISTLPYHTFNQNTSCHDGGMSYAHS
ncbi:MAG TPA: glycosyltransferase [Ktedonosporobacter sp.]|nr:glycosyltransferase [Ktedonosporobacter sp.]